MWTDALTPLRILLRGIFLLLVFLALIPTLACINRLGRAIDAGGITLEERMIRWWSGLVCRAFGVRVRCAGQPQPGPVLVVANHISWLDISVLHSTAAMAFVSKAEIGGWPVFGHLARAGGTIFHERGSHDSQAAVSGAMQARLKEGQRVAIFPEGGIRPGDEIGVFHARLFRPAVEVDCPVQPVMIRYMNRGRRETEMTFINNESFLVNVLRLLGRPTCVAEVSYLDPFRPEQRPRRDLATTARAAVVGAYESGL